MIAHVGGLPLDEIVPAVTAASGGLLSARIWLMLRLSRRRAAGR